MGDTKDKSALFNEYLLNGNLEKMISLYLRGGIDIGENTFIWNCSIGYLKVAKWIYSLGRINIHAQNDLAFVRSCENGRLEVAKWLFSLGGIDIHAHNEGAFIGSCRYGYLGIATWLFSLGGINIHAQNEEAFVWSCQNGHVEIAKLLFSLGGINIHAQNDSVFVSCCKLEIVNWLCTICNTFKMIEEKYIYLTSTKESIEGKLEENIMNDKITLDEDILKFGMFYGMKNVVIKCLDNKVGLPMGSLKFLFTKERSNTNKHEIWVRYDKIPKMNDNKENIVKILYNYGYTLNEEDKKILKIYGIDSKEFV